MPAVDHEPPDPDVPAQEAARIRARDRKRRTAMVVDNAGVKRIQLARAQRRRPRRPDDAPAATD